MQSFFIPKIAFIGLGLIGGSLAAGLKKAKSVSEVWAIDSDINNLNKAIQEKIADRICDYADLNQVNAIVLATPVGIIRNILEKLQALNLPENILICDVGSTKQSVFDDFQEVFGKIPKNFVAAHPIAGREKSGIAAVDANLFQNHQVIITPHENNENKFIEQTCKIWQSVGAKISQMPAQKHDEIMAATSHIPHILAYLFVDMLSKDVDIENVFSYAAGGFRDFTRIASSSAQMWRDICLHNPDNILNLLNLYAQKIDNFADLIKNNSQDEILQIFQNAKSHRDQFFI